LRYLGFVGEDEGEFGWLFIEDAGDGRYGPTRHRRLLARWLGTLHGAAAALELPSSLPERGPDQHLEHLRAARATIFDGIANPALRAVDKGMLRALLSTFDRIESGWGGVESICADLPRTLVHGDLAHRHLRLRRDEAGPAILAFDWEWSGRGVPAADVHLLAGATRADLACYRSAVLDHATGLGDDDLQALLLVGNGFRLLACADWVSTDLSCPEPEYAVEALGMYEQSLTTWAAELATTA